jgi:bacterial/archaeal transporter family-2 protein
MSQSSHVPVAPASVTDAALAFLSGGILALMVLFNGAVAEATTPFFSSLAAHGIGGLAACLALVLARRMRRMPPPAADGGPRAPLWAYLAGISGAATVMLTSMAVNTPLALSGTIALGLAGQAAFALVADRVGLFGMMRRRIGWPDLAAFALVLAGSLLIVFAKGG